MYMHPCHKQLPAAIYLQVDDAEVAAVAKAQRDLLADAPNLESLAVTDTSQPKLGPHDFDILRVVGQGAFGKIGLECCGVVNLYRLQRQAL
jgi:hypothetical protein